MNIEFFIPCKKAKKHLDVIFKIDKLCGKEDIDFASKGGVTASVELLPNGEVVFHVYRFEKTIQEYEKSASIDKCTMKDFFSKTNKTKIETIHFGQRRKYFMSKVYSAKMLSLKDEDGSDLDYLDQAPIYVMCKGDSFAEQLKDAGVFELLFKDSNECFFEYTSFI